MYQRTLVAIVLCGISSLCFAQTDCDAIAGMAAGEASYRYDSAQVKTSDTRLHFYSAPASGCQLPAFLVHGNTVEILRDSVRYTESGGIDDASKRPFYYVRYRDTKGVFATGWITAAGLAPLANPLPVPPACQTWANGAMPTRKSTAPASDNHYQIQGSERAWFYSMPNEQCRSNAVFLVEGDTIATQEQSDDDFVESVYYTADHRIVRGWLKKSRLQPLNSGDSYRDDINPLSTDKASRIITLALRNDYQCTFYESWNDEKNIQIKVREDHQSDQCLGAGDPETSPAVAYIDINKQSGKITWPDISDDTED